MIAPGSPEQRNRRIFLAGFMGSGKSTIGPILANTIGYDFVDLDREIERVADSSINAIFREHGEQHFRALETDVLTRLQLREQLVVALGGGTVTVPGNLALVRSAGIMVYLKTSREQILRRLKNKSDRPLLAGPDGTPLSEEELLTRITALYDLREPLYAQADIILVTGESRIGITVDQLVRRLTPLLAR